MRLFFLPFFSDGTIILLLAFLSMLILVSSNSLTGLQLDSSGSFIAQELPTNLDEDAHEWLNSSCIAGSYRDFFIDVTESLEHFNMFVEVIHSPSSTQPQGVRPNALSLMIFYEEIPSDRKDSGLIVDSSPDGVYSLVVNANEIQIGKYFIVVKCGDLGAGTTEFGVIVMFQDAELRVGSTRTFFICPDEILYYYVRLSGQNVSSSKSVHFTLCIPEDSSSHLTLVTRTSYPPLRAKTPMEIATGGSNTSCVSYDVCNDALDAGNIWAGVFGSGLCGSFNISVDFETDINCTEDRGSEDNSESAIPLKLEHVDRSSCGPYQWVDFVVSVFLIIYFSSSFIYIFILMDLVFRS